MMQSSARIIAANKSQITCCTIGSTCHGKPFTATSTHSRPRIANRLIVSASAAASDPSPIQPTSTDPVSSIPPSTEAEAKGFFAWWKTQQAKTANLNKKLAALGLAAVLAYGMFDGVSYTIAFTIAFLGYEARTGLNPTQNVADIVKICILMWAGNNVTRPFRLAGAAALAPFMDKVMDKLQAKLKLPNKAWAFALVVAAVALPCFAVVGGLCLSRLVI